MWSPQGSSHIYSPPFIFQIQFTKEERCMLDASVTRLRQNQDNEENQRKNLEHKGNAILLLGTEWFSRAHFTHHVFINFLRGFCNFFR